MPPYPRRRRAAEVATVRLAQLLRAPEAVEAAFVSATHGPAAGEEPATGRRWSPSALRGARVAVDVRAAAAVVLLGLVGVASAAWFAWRGSTATAPAPAAVVVAAGRPLAATGAASPSTSAAGLLVVDVAGRVRRPGLVRLPPGSRVADALAAAGGSLPGVDLATINLARAVADGEQVLVGAPPLGGGAGPAASAGGPTGPGAGSASVNLNTATLDQLEALPGVGPVLAQRILDWRTAHGRFSSVQELREVGGIGAKKYADIAPRASV